ncbi:MAG TPA: hypothetical protein VGN11_02145 [Candidatus Baltobacteraceae bacterium]|jgi:threonine dehydrogenase-like Zn-dependent dehydrogenase|nr:hypothetical protein [Candidatus Baltobacteraceae bacterium]
MTRDIGADYVIDAVGVDAYARTGQPDRPFAAGDAPSQALEWAVDMAAKAGHVSLVGVYPPSLAHFPIGKAFGKNLTLRMGDCPHRRYLPKLVRWVAEGTIRLPNFSRKGHRSLTPCARMNRSTGTRRGGSKSNCSRIPQARTARRAKRDW